MKNKIKRLKRKAAKLPKRVVVTAGMPYGNKEIHIGHISTFIWADYYAAFMRSAIGDKNVFLTSGTDSYGSMITEKARELKLTEEQVVEKFHQTTLQTQKDFELTFDMFGATNQEPLKTVHKDMSNSYLKRLIKKGLVQKASSPVFYDEKLNMFLNGRQVLGHCPISGCKSEEAYADECSLGHQFSPTELIAPKSKLSDTVPVIRECFNYYFDLPKYSKFLEKLIGKYEKDARIRETLTKEMREWLHKPMLYVHEKDEEALNKVIEGDKNNGNFFYLQVKKDKNIIQVFEKLEDREQMGKLLLENKIKFRTNKTLTPARLTGNVQWGIPVEMEGMEEERTFYCWPESLWCPISSTVAKLGEKEAKKFWHKKDSQITQIIGEDNIFFYAVEGPALFRAYDKKIIMPTIVPNKHTLIGGAKAASSGKKRAPIARELLEKYTKEQIKMYILGQEVAKKTSEFRSKAFFPELYPHGEDVFLREGNILTNSFNRILRTYFYTANEFLGGELTLYDPSYKLRKEIGKTMEEYKKNILEFNFHKNIVLMEEYFKTMNKKWSDESEDILKRFKELIAIDDKKAKKIAKVELNKFLSEFFYKIKAGLAMVQPIAKEKCEAACEMLNIKPEAILWRNKKHMIDKYLLVEEGEKKRSRVIVMVHPVIIIDDKIPHKIKPLPPK
ncbi:MAG: class I tRNA ligase family protein, partial [Firmicutes bacterium]|nr:class I tRNA ligase family protein [Bacillota bacterium]